MVTEEEVCLLRSVKVLQYIHIKNMPHTNNSSALKKLLWSFFLLNRHHAKLPLPVWAKSPTQIVISPQVNVVYKIAFIMEMHQQAWFCTKWYRVYAEDCVVGKKCIKGLDMQVLPL